MIRYVKYLEVVGGGGGGGGCPSKIKVPPVRGSIKLPLFAILYLRVPRFGSYPTTYRRPDSLTCACVIHSIFRLYTP